MQQTKRARRRPGLLIAAGLVGVALVAAACGDDDSSSDATTTAAGATTTAASGGATTTAASGGEATTTAAPATTAAPETPKYGGVVRVGVEAETDGWVPAKMQCDSACQIRARTLFEPLMALSDKLEIEGYLLDSATPNSTYDEWTLQVREGVTFHDGSTLDAETVVANLKMSMVTGFVGLAYADVVGAGPGADPAGVGVSATGPMTVVVKTKRPWVTFPYYLTGQGAFMSSLSWLKEACGADLKTCAAPTEAGTKPVGTGPFMFESWTPADIFKVKKAPNYWRKDKAGNAMPYLDGVEFKVIPDAITRGNALKAGDLDMLAASNGPVIKDFRGNDDFEMVEQAELTETFHILLHAGQEGSPLADQRVRCGLTAATDKKTLAETTGAGVFPVANGPFSPGQQGFMDSTGAQEFDMDKAKELIASWSADNGGQKPKIIYSTVPDSTSLATAQLLQQWWNEAGADVQINQIEQQKLILNALLGDKDFNAFGWRNHAGVVLDNQYFWWHSSAALPSGAPALNFGRMRDPVIDKALDDARGEPDLEKQKALAESVNQQFAKECWLIPTTWTIWGIPHTKNVKGIGTATFPDSETLLRDGAGFPGQVWFYNVWLES